MAFLQAVFIGLLALIIAPGWLFYFDVSPKVVVLMLGCATLLMVATRSRETTAAPRYFSLLLLLNAASLGISTLFSGNRALSLYGSTWRSFGFIVQVTAMLFAWMVAWQCAGRPDRVRVLLRGFAIAGIAAAAYGIAQYFGFDPWLPKATYRIGEGIWTIVRPPGTLGYASYFATWLLVTLFLSAALARRESHAVWRSVAYGAAALSTVAMLMTGTRAAMVGLVAGIAVWLFWTGFRVPKKVLVAGAILLVCAAGFYYSPPGRQLRSRTRWFVEDPWGGARPLLWRDSLRMGLQHPVAGFGPEVFLGEFPHYESKELARAYPDFVHESPHNILLDALISQGLSGLLLLCGIVAAGFRAAWRIRTKHPLMAAGLAAALAAEVVSQQFTAFTLPTGLLLLVVVALAAALAAEGEQAQRYSVFKAIMPFVALACLYFGIRVAAADWNLQVTRRHLEAGELQAATPAYEQYWLWHNPGSTADIWYSRAWMDTARKSANLNVLEQAVGIAEQSAERATQNPEEPFAAWYNFAQILALRERYQDTENALRKASESHPNWFKPHWLLAQQYRLVGRRDEAEKEAALAVELDGGHHPEVTQTLQEIRTGVTVWQ